MDVERGVSQQVVIVRAGFRIETTITGEVVRVPIEVPERVNVQTLPEEKSIQPPLPEPVKLNLNQSF